MTAFHKGNYLCPGVPGAPGSEYPVHRIDRRVRSYALGLVENQHPVQGRTSLTDSNILFLTSFRSPASEQPAALLCPPPPNPSAIFATSTCPFDLKLTFQREPSLTFSSLNSTAISTPLMLLGIFTMPSVSSLRAPVCANIFLST